MLEETQETGNLGKIASTNPVKIAETEKTSTGKKYKIVYYGEKENRELGLLIWFYMMMLIIQKRNKLWNTNDNNRYSGKWSNIWWR